MIRLEKFRFFSCQLPFQRRWFPLRWKDLWPFPIGIDSQRQSVRQLPTSHRKTFYLRTHWTPQVDTLLLPPRVQWHCAEVTACLAHEFAGEHQENRNLFCVRILLYTQLCVVQQTRMDSNRSIVNSCFAVQPTNWILANFLQTRLVFLWWPLIEFLITTKTLSPNFLFTGTPSTASAPISLIVEQSQDDVPWWNSIPIFDVGTLLGYMHTFVQNRSIPVNQDNAYTLESIHGESIRLIGCTDDDCDCTSFILTKLGRKKHKMMEINLPRQALESLRDGIDSILEFHDEKCLDWSKRAAGWGIQIGSFSARCFFFIAIRIPDGSHIDTSKEQPWLKNTIH